MRIWLIRANELMPKIDGNDRLLRMGLLGEKLNEKKHDITWFASTFNHFKKFQYCNKDKIIDINSRYRLNLIWAPKYKKNISISRIINHKVLGHKLKKKMRKEVKPDLIFASFPTIEMAYAAVKYGKKNNVPVVIDIRDLWPDTFKQNLKGIMKKISEPFVKYLNKKTVYIMKNCYSITSISNDMLEWGIKKSKRQKKDIDQYFYIGYKKDNNKNNNNIKINGFDKNEFNVSFFATINNQFNYELIVEIAKRVEKDNIKFIICGEGPNLNRFKELANRAKNIIFLGWQDKKNIDYILRNSSVGLAPYKDTFDFQMSVSNKFSEYLSYELPIIITSSGYMKQLTDNYELGLASSNINEIVNFLRKLKNDDGLRKKISKNSKKIYNEMFDANVIYEELAKYLEKVSEEYEK